MRTFVDTHLLVGAVHFPGLEFELRWEDPDPAICPGYPLSREKALRVTCPEGRCNVTGKALSWKGRWWRLSEHMTDSEIVWTCWKAVITALEHEAREQFTFKGVPIADSHVDVHKLADFMAQPSVKDGRS